MSGGIVLGLAISMVVGRLLEVFLFGVSPSEPLLLVLAVAVLAATGFLAALLPARRGALVPPLEALRSE